MIETSCHCGKVKVAAPRRPRHMEECNCSYCRRINALYAYYKRDAVQVKAAKKDLEHYAWGHRIVRWFRCKHCGCFMFHERVKPTVKDSTCGVNLRMADQGAIDGVNVKMLDGTADTWGLIYTYNYQSAASA